MPWDTLLPWRVYRIPQTLLQKSPSAATGWLIFVREFRLYLVSARYWKATLTIIVLFSRITTQVFVLKWLEVYIWSMFLVLRRITSATVENTGAYRCTAATRNSRYYKEYYVTVHGKILTQLVIVVQITSYTETSFIRFWWDRNSFTLTKFHGLFWELAW